MTVGYSKTPLTKKLGIKAGMRVRVRNAPVGYRNLLRPLPARLKFTRVHDETTDLVHVFVRTKAELRDALPRTPVGKLTKKELVEEERAKRARSKVSEVANA